MGLWERLQNESEHIDVFNHLCSSGKMEGVKWCLENTPNGKKLQHMIENNKNREQMYPLLHAALNDQYPLCLILIQEHKKSNPKFLTTCDARGYNILIWASQDGHLQIMKEVIDIFIETGT